jgi:predicted oxidoreductase
VEKITLSEHISLSRIIYGMWRLADDSDTSTTHIQAKIEACLEQGISTFDQADIYGGYTAEGLLGATLRNAPHLRDQMQIITKCGIVAPMGIHSDKSVKHYNTSADYIIQSVERSLKEMAIDTIDLLLIHRPDPFINADETGTALDTLVNSGKVKGVGVSNFRSWDMNLLQSRMSNPLLTNQIEISLQENSALTNGDLAYLQQHRVHPMAWSPLGGGLIFQDKSTPLHQKLKSMASSLGVDISSVAIAWLLAHPAAILPVMGSNNLQRIKLFSEALRIKLDRQSWFELLESANGQPVP